MADSPSRRKKPRIRKTAPTIRQQAEAAQAELVEPTKGRMRARLAQPGKRLAGSKLRHNPATKGLGKAGRPVAKVLGWLVPRYFINSWREVRQVTWPGRRETWRLTGAVFIFAIIFGIIVASVDKGLDELFRKLVLK